jgi:ATP-dependent DNA ligase
MSSPNKKSSQKENLLIEAVINKDMTTAHALLDDMLAGDQLIMPGFSDTSDKKDPGREHQVRSILQKFARKAKIPNVAFQTAFGRCSDLYLVVDALASENPINNLNKIQPMVYSVIRPARALRVSEPKIVWDHYNGGEWIVQQKMDGWYGQVHIMQGKVVIYSRKGEVLTFTSAIESKLSQIFKADNVILECELVGVEPTGNIAPRMEIRSQSNYVRAYFFDLLYWNDDWTRQPYEERFNKLLSILSLVQDDILRIVVYKKINSETQFIGCFDEWNNQNGLEGMIAKRPTEIYEADCESKEFLKIKVKDTVDAIVMGYINSPRSYLLGILNEDKTDFVPFVWVTIPIRQKDILVDEIKLHVHPNLPSINAGGRATEIRTIPGLVVEVEGDKIYKNDKYDCGKKQTGSGWSLFEARILQMRVDKGPNDVTTVDAFLNLNRMAGYAKQ